VDESCDPIFRVLVNGLDMGEYAVFVNGVDESTGTPLTVADDGAGELRFDANPEADDPDELLLDFAVGSGSLVEVVQGTTIFLTVTLP